ncbi:MAG TPA: RNA-binding protein [Candidatus Pacearchaeota archaeon]|nr:RNA-binding protein [Candidatus Pacearchaeota archaeon]
MEANEEAKEQPAEQAEETAEAKPEASPSKVYVGNLPFSVDDDELRKLFSSYGEMSEVSLISDKFSGRSKGFGFVTFVKSEDAQKAISEMNDKDIQGRPLKVSEAKPMDPDRPRAPRRDFGGGGRGNFGGGRGRSGGGRDRPRRF